MGEEKILLGKYEDDDEHYIYPIETVNPEPDVIEGVPDAEDITGEMIMSEIVK
jgi:hypothetical protein